MVIDKISPSTLSSIHLLQPLNSLLEDIYNASVITWVTKEQLFCLRAVPIGLEQDLSRGGATSSCRFKDSIRRRFCFLPKAVSATAAGAAAMSTVSALHFALDLTWISFVKSTTSDKPRAMLYRSLMILSWSRDKKLLVPSGGRATNLPGGRCHKISPNCLFLIIKGISAFCLASEYTSSIRWHEIILCSTSTNINCSIHDTSVEVQRVKRRKLRLPQKYILSVSHLTRYLVPCLLRHLHPTLVIHS